MLTRFQQKSWQRFVPLNPLVSPMHKGILSFITYGNFDWFSFVLLGSFGCRENVGK